VLSLSNGQVIIMIILEELINFTQNHSETPLNLCAKKG